MQATFPARLARENCAAICGSFSGSQDAASIPLQLDQSRSQVTKCVIQAKAALGRAQLAGVRRADRDRNVARREAGFQHVELAVPLEPVERDGVPEQPELFDHRKREVPLVAGIVHRKHHGSAARFIAERAVGAQVERQERAVPVVGMQQYRTLDELPHAVEACKEREAAVIVGVVGSVLAVEALAGEIAGRVDEDQSWAIRRIRQAEERALRRTTRR